MRKALVTMTATAAVLGAGLMSAAQAGPTASRSAMSVDNAFQAVAAHYNKRTHRHAVRQSGSEITSFSSSSGVGVNHPPKK